MTKKADLQKELLEKVKLGTKPSDIKHLKRSRSLGDIPAAPPPPPNLEQENAKLKTELTKITQQLKSLHEFAKNPSHPPTPILTDQLKEKQTQIEQLRKELEETHQKLTGTNQELDKSLEARHQALKEWEKQQGIIKEISKELDQTIDQASTELEAGDNQISQLRQKVYQLKIAKEQLEQELKLARINRPTPPSLTNSETTPDYLPYALYFLLAIWVLSVLNGAWKISLNLNELNHHD